MPKEKPRTQTERMMEDILATRRALLEGREPLNPRDKKISELGGDPYVYDEKVGQ